MTKPTFGVDRDPGVVAYLTTTAPYRRRMIGRKPLSERPNPMVLAVGEGPAGRICGECRFLVVKHDHGSRRYYGYEKRGPFTSGPGTDHLVGWPTCTAFEEETT